MTKTLDQWADERVQCDDLEKDPTFGGMFDRVTPGYIYDGGYIEGPFEDGMYHLLIERSEWTSRSLERLEGILYQEWYLPEIAAVHHYVQNLINN